MYSSILCPVKTERRKNNNQNEINAFIQYYEISSEIPLMQNIHQNHSKLMEQLSIHPHTHTQTKNALKSKAIFSIYYSLFWDLADELLLFNFPGKLINAFANFFRLAFCVCVYKITFSVMYAFFWHFLVNVNNNNAWKNEIKNHSIRLNMWIYLIFGFISLESAGSINGELNLPK